VVQQLEPLYGNLLSRYGRLLRQRSQLLRRGLSHALRQEILDAFDQQMALLGARLHRRRRRALERLEPLAALWQERLGGGREPLRLGYRSGTVLEGEPADPPWQEELARQLRQQRELEERLGRCQAGPHRDEIELLLDGRAARRFGSAGQQRTLVLALKLAELTLVEQVVGLPPLLLLDDVLAELDAGRQRLLLEAVGEGHQCLVSATQLEAFDAGWRSASQVVGIEGGNLMPS
jgi:DNA replication and repair protein RecF